MSAVIQAFEKFAAFDFHPSMKWLLASPLVGIFGRLGLWTAMTTAPSGRWSIRFSILVFLVLSGLSIAVAATVALCLYAFVSPGAGLEESLKKFRDVVLSLPSLNTAFASNSMLQALGQLLVVGLVSVWGACAVWIAERAMAPLRNIWRELPHAGGSFLGEPKVRLLEDGRKVEVLEDYGFRDSRGKVWTAPSGTIVDGASIPRFFWQTFGPPFCGRYRNASIVHDYYCQTRTCPASEVHRMFYEACLAEGLSHRKARLAYLAVQRFGPYWGEEARIRILHQARQQKYLAKAA